MKAVRRAQEEGLEVLGIVEEINRYITSDTLGYLSREGMREAAGDPGVGGGHFCDACFSGYYPVKFPRLKADSQLGLF